MTRRQVLGGLAALVVAVGVVTGLVLLGRAGDTGSGGSAASLPANGAADGRAESAAGPAGTAGSDSAGSNSAGSNLAGSNSAGSNSAFADVVTRSVVRTATIAVTVADPAQAAAAADGVATGLGGHVDSDVRGSGTAAAHLVLRVPGDRLDAALTALAGLGEQTGREVTGTDVTDQTADLDARVQALQTSVTRLQTLLGTSASLGDLLQVETQLTQRQADLESLQAQQQALAGQVAYASVTVDLSAPATLTGTTPSHGPAGFGSAVADGWRGFVLVLRWCVAVLGYLLPVLVLAGLVAAAVVGVRRRRGGTAAAGSDGG